MRVTTTSLMDFLTGDLGYERVDRKIIRPDGSIVAHLGTEPGTLITWYALLSPRELRQFAEERVRDYNNWFDHKFK